MKYLVSFLMMLMLALPVHADEKHDWTNLHKLKNDMENVIENVTSIYGDLRFEKEDDAKEVRVRLITDLLEIQEKTPFKFEVLYSKPPNDHGNSGIPNMVMTIVAKYEDPRADITFGWNVAFFGYKMEYYFLNKIPPSEPADAYKYLTLYSA